MMKTKEQRPILVYSDLDGTFMDSRGKTVERNLRAMERFRAEGGRISFATGRSFSTIEQVLLPGYDKMINAPAIMCNGACVYDAGEKKVLFEALLDGRVMRPLVEEIKKECDFKTFLYSDKEYNCYCGTPLSDIAGNDWHKVVFSGSREDVEKAKRIADEFLKGFALPPFHYVQSSPFLLEFLGPEAGKGAMVENIRHYYREKGIDPEIWGIGDFDNDMELLRAVDVPVCPSNALDEVKAICRYIVCSNDEGAIADLIALATGGKKIK